MSSWYTTSQENNWLRQDVEKLKSANKELFDEKNHYLNLLRTDRFKNVLYHLQHTLNPTIARYVEPFYMANNSQK